MQVQRTLVKSPPELWAEVSDVESLTRHLGELGEIRITRIAPEKEVAWEGEAARGTVALEASGWGTKVTLTAEPAEVTPGSVAVDEPPAGVAWFADPVATAQDVPVVDVEASEEVVELEAAVAVEPEPVVEAPKRGFFARLLRRRAAEPEAVEEPVAVELPGPPPGGDPVPPTPSPDPAPPAPDPGPPPPPAPAPPQIAATPDLEAVLTSVLDDLGAAHHRPFSRG